MYGDIFVLHVILVIIMEHIFAQFDYVLTIKGNITYLHSHTILQTIAHDIDTLRALGISAIQCIHIM